jgi:hypothetical protein
MLQPRGDRYLANESVSADGLSDLAIQNLYRDDA